MDKFDVISQNSRIQNDKQLFNCMKMEKLIPFRNIHFLSDWLYSKYFQKGTLQGILERTPFVQQIQFEFHSTPLNKFVESLSLVIDHRFSRQFSFIVNLCAWEHNSNHDYTGHKIIDNPNYEEKSI